MEQQRTARKPGLTTLSQGATISRESTPQLNAGGQSGLSQLWPSPQSFMP